MRWRAWEASQAKASSFHKPGKCRRGRAKGFLKAWGWRAPRQEQTRGRCSQLKDRMSQAPRCFPHMVSVLRSGSWHPRGKPGPGLEEILQHHARIRRGWEVSGLPISDLQHVSSCFTFSLLRVAAPSPVMGSAEVSGSQTAACRRRPSREACPVLGTWP